MNISEMHIAFKLELDKSNALELPSFLPEEIDYWLNAAIRRFVKTRYSGSMSGLGFEENTKRMEDLRTLIHHDVVTSFIQGPYGENSYAGIIEYDAQNHWFLLGDSVIIRYHSITGDIETKIQGVTQCTIDTLYPHLTDPFSEHILHYEEAKPLRLLESDRVILVTDGNYTIDSYAYSYMSAPEIVSLVNNVDCNLPEHTHDEIVKNAVNMALENIEQPRYSSHQYELNRVE